jgi:hypothetical protein
VGVLRQSGCTVLNLPQIQTPEPVRDEFLDAVQAVAAGDYDVLGEIGRNQPDDVYVYLAREAGGAKLVALRLAPCEDGSGEFTLDVVTELDSSMPAFDSFCTKCGGTLRKWGKFCPKCGADLFGAAATEQGWSGPELRAAVEEFARGKYDILGEMGTQGGGRVYFGRDLATGTVDALRLQKLGEEEFSLGVTGVLKPIVQSAVSRGGPAPATPPVQPAMPPPAPPPVQPQPPRPAGPGMSPAPEFHAQPEDQWAPLREFVQQPVVLVAILVAAILFLMIVLALIS